MATQVQSIYAWLRARLPIDNVVDLAEHKTVPVHRYSICYYVGGMTLFFFIVQVVTGILLMLYYRPSAGEAFESVEFLMTTVPFGWLIRSIHSWSANLMIFFLFVHLATVYFMKAYRPPREITWVTGSLLLFLALAFGFSGYLLPWNRLAFFATNVGTDIAGAVPIVGEYLLRFLRGGDRVTGGTLSRFYGWHVAILPAITTAVLGIHLLLVQIQGMSVPPSEEEVARRRRPMKFVPELSAAGHLRLDIGPGPAGDTGGAVSVGTGGEGRPLCSGLRRHPPRVVLHVHVRNAEVRSRRRDPGHRI